MSEAVIQPIYLNGVSTNILGRGCIKDEKKRESKSFISLHVFVVHTFHFLLSSSAQDHAAQWSEVTHDWGYLIFSSAGCITDKNTHTSARAQKEIVVHTSQQDDY